MIYAEIHQLFGHFSNLNLQKYWGRPIPCAVCISRPWAFSTIYETFSVHCCLASEKEIRVHQISGPIFCCFWTKVHQLKCACTEVIVVCNSFPTDDTLLKLGDIHDQVIKMSKIVPKIWCFWTRISVPRWGALVSVTYSLTCTCRKFWQRLASQCHIWALQHT